MDAAVASRAEVGEARMVVQGQGWCRVKAGERVRGRGERICAAVEGVDILVLFMLGCCGWYK